MTTAAFNTPSSDPLGMVRAMCDEVLRRSGLKGIIPTPLDELARWVGISEVLDIGEFNDWQRDAHRRRRAPGVALKRFLGALLLEPKVVLVDTSKPEEMQRWTQAHELAHKSLRWHVQSMYLDDDVTLSRETKAQREHEANTGGAHFLFQGSQFWDQCRSYRRGLAVPVALASSYAASLTATIRYYVETNPDPVALLCISRYVQDRSRTIAFSDQSPPFASRFGSVGDLFPRRLPLDGGPLSPSVCTAIRFACEARSVGYGGMSLRDLNGDAVELDVETFFNGYSVFVLLMPHRRLSFGRRLHVDAPKGPG